jgi:hypothetical protein
MNEVVNFLGVVITQINRSNFAYKSYIESGNIFMYAKILKTSNDELRDLLVSKSHLLPLERYRNALALIHHIDVWSVLWEDAFLLLSPSINSVFKFDNEVNFPKKDVESLIIYYNQIALLSTSPSSEKVNQISGNL